MFQCLACVLGKNRTASINNSVFGQNMNLRINSQYHYNTLPQHMFQFVNNVRFFFVGDEYRSTGRNVFTNLQIWQAFSHGSYHRNSYY